MLKVLILFSKILAGNVPKVPSPNEIVVIPITCPNLLTVTPPLLPCLMLASVDIKGIPSYILSLSILPFVITLV